MSLGAMARMAASRGRFGWFDGDGFGGGDADAGCGVRSE
jgi:hypothetical protein